MLILDVLLKSVFDSDCTSDDEGPEKLAVLLHSAMDL